VRHLLCWSFVPLCWALGCGGRVQLDVADNQATGGSSSGGVSSGQGGAAASGAGRNGQGKSGSGANAAGGGVGAGGANAAGGGCACDLIECGPGYHLVANDVGCCYHCEQDSPGCDQQLASYLAFRQPLIDKAGTVGCNADSDCGFYYDANPCQVAGCGIPLSNSVIGDLSVALSLYAQTNCDLSCPPVPVPPCDPVLHTVCLNGHCR